MFSNIAAYLEDDIQQLFETLRDHLRGRSANVPLAVEHFSDELFALLYQDQINPRNRRVDGFGSRCIAGAQRTIRPFGNAPQELGTKLYQSVELARLLLTSLQLGVEVLNSTHHMQVGKKCARALLEMKYCGMCQGFTTVKPCENYCVNVMTGCMANFVDIDPHWNEYVTSVINLVRWSMAGDYDLQLAIGSLDSNIIDAITLATEDSERIIQEVSALCRTFGDRGRPFPAQNRDFAIQQPSLSMPMAPNPSVPLDKRLLSFMDSLDRSRMLYSSISRGLCAEGLMASSRSNDGCWNGVAVDSVVAHCSSSTPDGTKAFAAQHVVIVGGGYAGTALANSLVGKCRFTLIDPKECFHHNLGALRACVEKGYAVKTFVPYKPAYGDNFKQGTVKETDAAGKKVVLEGGEEIPYDYLVLATGTTGYFPCKLDLGIHRDVQRTIKMYDIVVEKMQAAKDIVIIGGGPAGIELGGEIVTDMKDKKVTLIHSRAGLINNGSLLTDKFRQSIQAKLVKHGVNVLMDQRVTNLNAIKNGELRRCVVKTDKGNSVNADLVFVCTGMKTNTSAYSSTFADKMDSIGCLKVDDNLRVEGTTDVFAIGDCSTADADAKMAFKAGFHGKLVAQNIQADVEGNTLKPYKPMGAVMCVPIGRNAGVTQMKGWVVGDFITRNLKGQGLFTKRYWGELKQTMPK